MSRRLALLLPAILLAATGVGHAQPAGGHALRAQGHLVSLNATESTNWAGYNQGFLDHDVFTQIGGDWTVQTATQHTAGRAESSATWIGIGGGCATDDCLATDQTLIQAGTESNVDTQGRATYGAWYEIIPAPSLGISMEVQPGDHMHVDLSQIVPDVWVVTIKDVTTNSTFAKTIPYPSTMGSAEWILETPVQVSASNPGFSAMPNLTRTTFTGLTVNGASPNLQTTQEMRLVNGALIALPSAPGSDHRSFNVCTYASSCPAP
jgi:hypothetical protein